MICQNSGDQIKINAAPKNQRSLGTEATLDELSFNVKRAIQLLIIARSEPNPLESLEMAIWHIEEEIKKCTGETYVTPAHKKVL